MTEYKVICSAGLPTEAQLNELANGGWELVQIVPNAASRDRFEYAVYLMRRPAQNGTRLSVERLLD